MPPSGYTFPVRRLLLTLVVVACAKAGPPPKPYKVDIHTHFAPEGAAHLVEIMDQQGIDVAVNLSGAVPGRGLELQLAAAAKYPGRILVFCNLDWRKARGPSGYGRRMAEDLVTARNLGAVGLKIPKALGLGYLDGNGAIIAVDDPELDAIFVTAGELGMPVAIHTADPVAFWKPATRENERYAELSVHPDWSFFGQGLPSWEELFAQLERRIARHPKTTFISVHFGNAAEYPDRVAALLERYPNLYVDTAARIPEMGRHDGGRMRDLLVRYQDRVLFGTDLGVGEAADDLMLGSTGATPPTAADVDRFWSATWRYFETRDRGFPHPTAIQGEWTIDGVGLPREALVKIYGANAARLLGIKAR